MKFNFWPFKKTNAYPDCQAPQQMVVNGAGKALIKVNEGLRLKAYRCSAGVCTIGYGSTRGLDCQPVQSGDEITEGEAEALFNRDILVFSSGVRKLCKVDLNQNQFSALVSLAYNIGLGNFRASTLLRKLNRSDYDGCSSEFWKWRRANGKILAGLVARREKERKLFISV